MTTTVSIVGMACRYPDADNPEQLWQNVLAQRSAFRRLPEERLGLDYRGSESEPDRTYLERAALLRDWDFDRSLFGVPGSLHRAVDHTHWLALETAAAALADAGAPRGAGLDRDAVGVVLGNSLTGEFSRAASMRLRWPAVASAATEALKAQGMDAVTVVDVLGRMEESFKAPFPIPGDETLAGALSNTIAGRICNVFDFHGTGFTVDGACSSSLLAVNTACAALVEGDVDVVIAGGVDLSIDPFELVGFSRLGALSTGPMRVYDAQPTGFLPGEGCGMVVLMRTADARAHGRRSYAEIAGWASSSDGAGGLTRPEVGGQVRALQRAYRRAGFDPAEARLVEGHGTGTAIGDEVELTALTTVRGRGSEPAALGSVKANIGHTKAAAGVAGLIKAVQAVHRRTLPPTTGCAEPHALLNAADVPLEVLDRARAWPEGRAVAGVSSMGFGGINAHVVVAGPDERVSRPAAVARDRWWSTPAGKVEILPVGAAEPRALARRLERVAASAKQISDAEIRDLAATTWREDGHHGYRACVVAANADELVAGCRAAAAATAGWDGGPVVGSGWAIGSRARPAEVGLVFPGQAAPVRGHCPPWAEEPARAGDVNLSALPAPTGAEAESTAVAQPWIVAQTLLGLRWLDRIGCTAGWAVGHSLGEIASLVWAGALSPADAVDLACSRGRLMADYGRTGTGMAAVTADPEAAGDLLDGTDVVVAAHNGPGRSVLSGTTAELATVLNRADAAGLSGILLPVSHGFHSPAMADVNEPLRTRLADVALRPTERDLLSPTTGGLVAAGTDADTLRKLLLAQLTDPVLFDSVARQLADRCDLIVEVGPGTMMSATCAHLGVPTVALDAGGPDRAHATATAVVAACAGADLDAWFDGRPARRLSPADRPSFLRGAGAIAPARDAGAPVTGPSITRIPAPPARSEPTSRDTEGEPSGAAATAEPAPPDDGDALSTLTAHLAAALELPPGSIEPGMSLLGDLHLSSLQVMHTMAVAAGALGVASPQPPASVAQMTVADLAEALHTDTPSTAAAARPVISSIRPWVRTFRDRWELVAAPDSCGSDDVSWVVDAPAGHAWHDLAPAGSGSSGSVVVWGGAGADAVEAERVGALLDRVRRARPVHLVLEHNGHPAAAGVARSLAAEVNDVAVTVVDASAGRPTVSSAGVLLDTARSRYREFRTTADGDLETRVASPHDVRAVSAAPLEPGSVCLVTGGATGVTARCARELARRTGAVLVFTGRTDPSDDRIQAALSDKDGGVEAHYIRCDLTDPKQIRDLLSTAAGHGPVRGLLHGAALNTPRRLADVSVDSLRDVLAPKIGALGTLLEAGADDWSLVVGFGSIIGRQGLEGQSEYCIANDWMRHRLESWGTSHPGTRVHTVEWSVWSGAGMAERLGVLENLRAAGVEPIDADQGAQLFGDLLADPDTPATVLATSRFAATDTLRLPGAPRTLHRFVENRCVEVPGVEVVAEASLSVGDDPYLADHRIEGNPVLPAVVGLEAMAQAAQVVRPQVAGARAFRGTRFLAPVVVAENSSAPIRVSALSDGDDVDVVLAAGGPDGASDRFVTRIVPAAPEPEQTAALTAPRADGPEHELYARALFHEGRFRRLVGYDRLTAFEVDAWVRADGCDGWFSAFHAPDLLLGDPGVLDASLHALLACVPHRLALPAGVDRLDVWRCPEGVLRVEGRERFHGDGEYVFDVDVRTADGLAVCSWKGLHLVATGGTVRAADLEPQLVGPWLSRRLLETGWAGRVDLSTPDTGQGALWWPAAETPGRSTSGAARDAAAREVLGLGDVDLVAGRSTDDGLVETLVGGVRRVVTAEAGGGLVAVELEVEQS